MSRYQRLFQSFTIVVLAISVCGCQSFQRKLPTVSLDKLAFWKAKEVVDGSNVQKMVALWSDNVVYGAQIGAKRGLGGRIYFYDEEQKPAKVSGQLVVYAYDDDKEPNATKADRKFVFSKEEFEAFYSESEFGPSYSVWIPWDDVGNPQRSVSLVPIFKSDSGKVLIGEHSRSLLPGRKKSLRESTTTSELTARKRRTDIRRVSFDETEDETPVSKNIRRSSIRMPDTMRQRLANMAKERRERVYFQPIEKTAPTDKSDSIETN